MNKFLSVAAGVALSAVVAAPAAAITLVIPFSNRELGNTVDPVLPPAEAPFGGLNYLFAGGPVGPVFPGGAGQLINSDPIGSLALVTSASPALTAIRAANDNTFSFNWSGGLLFPADFNVVAYEVDLDISSIASAYPFNGTTPGIPVGSGTVNLEGSGSFSGTIPGGTLTAGERYIFSIEAFFADGEVTFDSLAVEVTEVPFEQDVALGASVVLGFVAFRKIRKARLAA